MQINQVEWDRMRRDSAAVDLIHQSLDGREWDSDTLDDISQIIKNTGRPIRGPLYEQDTKTPLPDEVNPEAEAYHLNKALDYAEEYGWDR